MWWIIGSAAGLAVSILAFYNADSLAYLTSSRSNSETVGFIALAAAVVFGVALVASLVYAFM